MGWEKSYFLSSILNRISTNKLKIVISLIILIISVLTSNLNVASIEYLLRDISQNLNSNINSTPLNSLATVNINATQLNSNNELTVTDLIDGIKKIIQQEPDKIILFIEPNDLKTNDVNDFLKLRTFIESNKIFLNRFSKSRTSHDSFDNLESFKDYPFYFETHLATDSDSDYFSTRRMLLDFHKSEEDGLYNSLTKMGISIKDKKYFYHAFENLETTQLYTKYPSDFMNLKINYPRSFELSKGKLKDKLIVISRFDEFGFLVGNKSKGLNSLKKEKSLNEKFVSSGEIVANQIRTLITGDYIKYISNSYILFSITLLYILLIWINLSIKIKIIATLLAGPLLVFINLIIYSLSSYLFNLTDVVIFYLIVQYIAIPYFVLILIRTIEVESAISKYKTVMTYVQDFSKSIAHDLRSPLSTIRLLSSRVSYSSPEEKILFSNSIDKINSILEELLNQNITFEQNKLKNFNSSTEKILSLLLNELKTKHPGHEFIFTNHLKEEILLNVSENDLYRIFLNILNNAVYASKSSKKPKVEINLNIIKSGALMIEIVDNGEGIPEKIKNMLGRKQISTKPQNEGKGLGIIGVVYLLNKNLGELKFKDNYPNGTIVEIEFNKIAQNAPGKVIA